MVAGRSNTGTAAHAGVATNISVPAVVHKNAVLLKYHPMIDHSPYALIFESVSQK